jgi:hypothetical protein
MIPPSHLDADLVALGIDPNDCGVIKLLPLVYVAWADGVIEPVERQRLFGLSEQHGISESGRVVLEKWLDQRPPDAFFDRGLSVFRRLATAPDELLIVPEDLYLVAIQAEAIARSHEVTPDAPDAISPRETRALDEIVTAFGVDSGDSWKTVLSELE